MKFDLQSMLEKVQQMQAEMDKVKQEINNKIVTAESGGGLVKATMNGANHLIKLEISPEIINANDVEMLEDLIIAAVNNATKAVVQMTQNEMSKLSTLLPNIPGLNLNL